MMISSDLKPVLYAASTAPLADDRLYTAAYQTISPARKNKINRYRMEKDRRLSLGAELLLRFALSTAGFCDPLPELEYGAQEKPFFKTGGIQFNLSHSEEYVLCAVSGCEVGCDIEKISPADLHIAERFFCREEYKDIAAQPSEEEKSEMFFRYWTLKESFMKATGLGMKLALNAFRIVLEDEISVIQSVDDRHYSFAEFRNIPGYRCALCAAGDCRETRLHIADLKEIL